MNKLTFFQAFLLHSKEFPVECFIWLEALNKGISAVKEYTEIDDDYLTFVDMLSSFVGAFENYFKVDNADLVNAYTLM